MGVGAVETRGFVSRTLIYVGDKELQSDHPRGVVKEWAGVVFTKIGVAVWGWGNTFRPQRRPGLSGRCLPSFQTARRDRFG